MNETCCDRKQGYDAMPLYHGPYIPLDSTAVQPSSGLEVMPNSSPLESYLAGVRTLAIPRAEDLPYWTSPPIQFVYESTIALVAGAYVWNDAPSVLTPTRPILQNALYFFRSVSLVADTTEFDFSTNVTVSPSFYMFRISDQNTMLFREPVLMNKFYDQFDFRLFWLTTRVGEQLRAVFVGTLVQGAGLIGKANITLKAIISAQEINDRGFVEAL